MENGGLSTKEALQRLHSAIQTELDRYEAEKKNLFYYWIRESFHHSSQSSSFRWPSIVLVSIEIIIYFVAFAFGHFINQIPLLIQGFVLLVILVFNVFIISWDSRMRYFELHNKLKLLCQKIAECRDSEDLIDAWRSNEFYPHSHSPQSPCISLQWTFRDGRRVNLPTALLVPGDIILLCPGRVAPGKCRNVDTVHHHYYVSEANGVELNAGDLFVPTADYASEAFTGARLRRAAKPVKFVMLEATYINYLKTILSQRELKRPATLYDKELHAVLAKYTEHLIVPIIFVIVLVASAVHYGYLESSTTVDGTMPSSITLLILRPSLAILPLLPLTLPVAWILLNAYGNIYIRQSCVLKSESGIAGIEGSPGSAIGANQKNSLKNAEQYYLEGIEVERSNSSLNERFPLKWKTLLKDVSDLLLGRSGVLWRSANLLQVLGSITALCCVDKKGILSWPNPTADKVFFFTSNKSARKESSKSAFDDKESDSDIKSEKYSPNLKSKRSSKAQFAVASKAEVLDITHDPNNAFGLQLDDPNWCRFLPNLKPLGLGILLNTCNTKAQEEYTQFCDHIACESLHNEAAVPVVNKRCLCELARQIGFTENAINGYEYEHQIAMFRHVRPEVIQKGKLARSLNFPRLKMPFPNIAMAVSKYAYTSTYQLFSQGTGDLILDASSEYWNGESLSVLTDSDRKRALDFYHRSSLTAYCVALSYVPLNTIMNHNVFRDSYIELPPDSSHLFPSQKSLDSSVRSDHIFIESSAKSTISRHLSSDSLTNHSQSTAHCDRPKSSASANATDGSQLEPLMHQISNQVFIGMITMQYQACPDFVQLIEQLESACIRFVHFSKENELRSRVFSEKMGLESGWNCHISLLNEPTNGDESGLTASTRNVYTNTSSAIRESKLSFNQDPHIVVNPLATRSQSAPGSVNLDLSAVKFVPGELVEKRKNNDKNGSPEPQERKRKMTATSDCSEWSDNDERTKFTSNLSPSPSHLTESTGTEQSAPFAFDISNRAKLPKGIRNIRPHLEKVDNVPLLVSLFTDCEPHAIKDMIEIMQEYGEVVCVLGSSSNISNICTFLQADASISVEPLFPQVCVKEPVYPLSEDHDSIHGLLKPVELANFLVSLPCSLSFHRDDSISLHRLIMEARHYMMSMRNSFQYLLCCSLSLSLAQLLTSLLFLPPLISPGLTLWLVVLIFPLLGASLMGTPVDPEVMKIATGKSLHLSKETIVYFLLCYLVKFAPSVIVVVICYASMIGYSCSQSQSIGQVTAGPCWMFSDVRDGDVNEDVLWNSHLLIAQTFSAYLIVIYFTLISSGFVHRSYLLWQRNPFLNRWWFIVSVVLILMHSVVCGLEIFVYVPSEINSAKFVASVPTHIWCLAFIWPLVLMAINTLVKRHEIKAYRRQQRRARLEFGTKLGMNSPF